MKSARDVALGRALVLATATAACSLANGVPTAAPPSPHRRRTLASPHAAAYDDLGKSYDKDVYGATRAELLGSIHAELYALFVLQLHNQEDAAHRIFERTLEVRPRRLRHAHELQRPRPRIADATGGPVF